MKIYKALNSIMAEVGGIEKNRRNEKQGYKFRGVDDVYAAIQPLLVKHGVITVPRVLESKSEIKEGKNGSLLYRVLTMQYDFVSTEDGSTVSVVVIGEGMDSGDKASNKAMSVAHKYAILQLFCIPTEEPKDPENDSPELVTPEKLKLVVDEFGKVNVSAEELEDFMNKPLQKFTNDDLEKLRPMIVELRESRRKEAANNL